MHRILVLDDDPIMRDLLEVLLTVDGYQPIVAASGKEGLERLRAGTPVDVVLTDLNMPGLEGRVLGEALREAMPASALLLAMSATPPSAETRAAFDGFLVKPFEMSALHEASQTAQRAREADSAHAGPGDAPEPAAAPVLDDAIFGSLLKMIPAAKLGELFTMTLDDIARRHERIVAAVDSGDLDTAKREAHAVKGSCGMVGAFELQNLAAAIENGTAVNTTAVREIPAACARLRGMLDQKLHTV